MNKLQRSLHRTDVGNIEYCLASDVAALETENERLRRLGIEEVMAEVGRATVKFPTWPTDPLHALAVLGEEFGELTKAMLQHTYEPEKSTLEDVHEEAIQTAAMALRLVKSLNVYEYRKGFQHVQAILNREQEK